ncbi:hypothetical protein [Microcoleus sp. FACHB-68]|uniref:hypothetical protein n=1 Tax=Microcoleus sp. FACHB-68 TaxID=2692826 RepID=UPI00168335AE|nr:hypothetical protein [Microcoleus sp. FACHB-68]MBD1940453.1 hypothetical protein [Microcoleus sp. FACHB-68]
MGHGALGMGDRARLRQPKGMGISPTLTLSIGALGVPTKMVREMPLGTPLPLYLLNFYFFRCRL